jgi:TonB dependent receptor
MGNTPFELASWFMRMRNGDLAYPSWPNLSFTGLCSGQATADFLIGRPQSFGGLTTIHDDGTAGQYQPYFQDDYKITSRLTLNLGLRYDLETPWTERHGGASTYSPGKQSRVYPTAPPGLVVPGDLGVPPGFITRGNGALRRGLALLGIPQAAAKLRFRQVGDLSRCY